VLNVAKSNTLLGSREIWDSSGKIASSTVATETPEAFVGSVFAWNALREEWAIKPHFYFLGSLKKSAGYARTIRCPCHLKWWE